MNSAIQRNLLIVKSKDRISGNSSDFKYSLGDVSLDIKSIALKSACIPHTHTNISDSNNTLIIETGTDFVLTETAEANYNVNGVGSIPITAGTYTLNTLIEALNTNQTFGEFTYDSGTNRVTFTVTDAGVNIAGVNFLTGGSPEIIGLLGFTLPVNCPTGIGSFIVAPNAPTYVENTVTSLFIQAGQYTAQTLLDAVVDTIQPYISGTIVGSITPWGGFQFSGATQGWRFNPSPLPPIFGWDTSITTFFTSLVAGYGTTDLYGTRNLYVSSRILANGYNSLDANGIKSSILGEIPVCSSQGGIDKYQADYLVKKDYPTEINISEFDIQILDDYNKPVDLKLADIVLVFEVFASVKL